MIPFIGVPILNRPDLLDELIDSIDYPVREMIIIDNGNVVTKTYPDWIKVVKLPHNIGCGAAWNLLFKLAPNANYWVISNSDIKFWPGTLEQVDRAVNFLEPAIYKINSLACFAITPDALGEIGLFDENFHPAYCEDIDFVRRAVLLGVPVIDLALGCDHVGSATIWSDKTYRKQNDHSFPENARYYVKKWGGQMERDETFTTPFNKGGHVSDHRVDIRRIRDLTWERIK